MLAQILHSVLQIQTILYHKSLHIVEYVALQLVRIIIEVLLANNLNSFYMLANHDLTYIYLVKSYRRIFSETFPSTFSSKLIFLLHYVRQVRASLPVLWKN